MLETIFLVVLCLFATYGFAVLIKEVVYSIWDREVENNSNFRLVLMIKDCEEEVEWVVQRILSARLPNGAENTCRLTVVDLGSTDDTREILERLSCKYAELEVLFEDEKEEVFEQVVENEASI